MRASIEFDVNQNWFDTVLHYSDIFSSSGIGYWARGVYNIPGKVWLICDVATMEQRLTEEMTQEAVRCLRDKMKLPEHFYALDKELLKEAYCAGVRRKGVDWYDTADSNDYDVAIQTALFGKVLYG